MVQRVKCHMEVQKQQANVAITLLCTSPHTSYLDRLQRKREIKLKIMSIYLQSCMHKTLTRMTE